MVGLFTRLQGVGKRDDGDFRQGGKAASLQHNLKSFSTNEDRVDLLEERLKINSGLLGGPIVFASGPGDESVQASCDAVSDLSYWVPLRIWDHSS